MRDRETFLAKHRAAAGDPDPIEAVPASVIASRDTNGLLGRRVAVFSLGNPLEAHGPALPSDIDDRTAATVSVRLCNATGARYLGPVPFTTDGLFELAPRWAPMALPPDVFLDELARFCGRQLEAFYDDLGWSRPDLVLFLSGHGGNRIVSDHLGELALALGVRSVDYTLCMTTDGLELGPIQHAASTEHAVAAALGRGCFDPEALAALGDLSDDATFYAALQRWPAFAGMAGFYLFGSDDLGPLRDRYPGVKPAVAAFVAERVLRADPELGRRILDHTVACLTERVGAHLTRLCIEHPLARPLPEARTEGAVFTLVHEDGRRLVQHRTDDAPFLPGYWGFFGGGIEPGESREQAVRREAEEELALALPSRLPFVGSVDGVREGSRIRLHLFVAPWRHSLDTLRAAQMEGQGLALVGPQDLPSLRLSAHDHALHAMVSAFHARGLRGGCSDRAGWCRTR